MKFSSKFGDVSAANTQSIVIARKNAQAAAKALGIEDRVQAALDSTKGSGGTAVTVFADEKPTIVAIVGSDDGATSSQALAKDLAAAARTVAGTTARDVTVALASFEPDDAYLFARQAVQAFANETYRFDEYRSKKPKAPTLNRLVVLADAGARGDVTRGIRHGSAIAEGLTLTKDLGNHPPNVCDPAFLAREAKKMAEPGRVTVNVIEEKAMEKHGMGALLSVSQGSARPAKLIIVNYKGGKSQKPVVLIGKGITFDTGGTNIKPSPGMDEMKFDMGGAAAVLGTARAVIEAKLPINLITIVAAAENMPGSRASRPSDVVTTMSGQTVEILNTDAEGRLVMCDAMTYAERYKPRAMIDVATLTGAQVVALGATAAGLFSNDDDLATALAEAGDRANDRMWRLPIWDEYQEALKSPVADMKNVGGREAGSITAACFLSRFANGIPWAHVDVAGPAFRAKKATGRPLGALFQYLLDTA